MVLVLKRTALFIAIVLTWVVVAAALAHAALEPVVTHVPAGVVQDGAK